MARAQGARAQMALAFETTYGTPPVGGFTKMPFASTSLGAEQPLLNSELLGYGRDPLAPIKDAVTADGDVVVPLDAEAFGFWLKAAFGDPTTTGTGPWTHEFQSGSWTLPSMSIETGMPEVPRFAMYSGCVLDQINWQMQRSGLLTATARLIAQGETVGTTTSAATPAALELQRFGHFNGAIARNGSALGNVVSADITYANNLDLIETIRSDGRIDGANPSIAALTGSIEVRFADQTLVTQAINGDPCELEFAYVLPSGESFTFTVHAVYLPRPRIEISGPQGVQATLDWQAARDSTVGRMCTATLINDIEVYWADSSGRRNGSRLEVVMTIRKRASDRSIREKVSSPGRPKAAHRSQQVLFWGLIAKGISSEEAAVQVGVSAPVGSRWFREAGGMPPSQYTSSAPALSGRYLCFGEREEIALCRAQGLGVNAIARKIGRAASTISRELRRNAATRSGGFEYRATTAQWHADRAARRPKATKLAKYDALRQYVEDRLSGQIAGPDGDVVAGPEVRWTKRRSVRRQHRKWALAWSPEQIARRLPLDYPEDPLMRISHEAIYQSLFIQGRGALRRELVACLRSGRALRVPRARRKGKGKAFVAEEIMISERPAEVADRAVPGHWEGDLILGLKSSAIGTLVERKTRFTLLLHLPPMPGHGSGPRQKNGPALAGHGAQAVRNAIAKSIKDLPKHLRKSLTWDQGAEMAQHEKLTSDTGIDVYFCDPQSPWQRGSNENTNGLLRQYFPKGTDLSAHGEEELEAVAYTLNSRPRKTLGWRTPAEALEDVLR